MAKLLLSRVSQKSKRGATTFVLREDRGPSDDDDDDDYADNLSFEQRIKLSSLDPSYCIMAALSRPSKATYEVHEQVTVDTSGK